MAAEAVVAVDMEAKEVMADIQIVASGAEAVVAVDMEVLADMDQEDIKMNQDTVIMVVAAVEEDMALREKAAMETPGE